MRLGQKMRAEFADMADFIRSLTPRQRVIALVVFWLVLFFATGLLALTRIAFNWIGFGDDSPITWGWALTAPLPTALFFDIGVGCALGCFSMHWFVFHYYFWHR